MTGAKPTGQPAKPLTLLDHLYQLDSAQARRFNQLKGNALDIATEGITRHLRACARMDVKPDISALREIIEDSLNGRSVFSEAIPERSR